VVGSRSFTRHFIVSGGIVAIDRRSRLFVIDVVVWPDCSRSRWALLLRDGDDECTAGGVYVFLAEAYGPASALGFLFGHGLCFRSCDRKPHRGLSAIVAFCEVSRRRSRPSFAGDHYLISADRPVPGWSAISLRPERDCLANPSGIALLTFSNTRGLASSRLSHGFYCTKKPPRSLARAFLDLFFG